MDTMLNNLEELFSLAQSWLFEAVFQPIAFGLGQGGFLLEAFNGTAWFLVGLLQIAVMLLFIKPLELWRPAQSVADKAAVRVDVLYTLLHRLGLFKLLMFFTFEPLFDDLIGVLRVWGVGTFHLDQIWPGISDTPVVSFVIYLVAFDLVNYWIHRGQHQFNWWWNLHAVHHSQRQMTMWTDNRNHLIDSVLVDFILVFASLAIGVAPSQFILIVAVTQLSESFQHANVKLWFGHIGERLWISPRFHRLHHSVGIGHETIVMGKGAVLGGHNFGVLLPWWDMIFGTANFELRFDATGIRDQVEGGRDYGAGFWAQQVKGIKRLFGRA